MPATRNSRDKEGNLVNGSVEGDRPGDRAARRSNSVFSHSDDQPHGMPKEVIKIATDGIHVSVSLPGQPSAFYEDHKAVQAPAASGQKKTTVRSTEMLGGDFAEQEIAGRKDLQQALPPEMMAALKAMARGGNLVIIENIDSNAPNTAPGGVSVTPQKRR